MNIDEQIRESLKKWCSMYGPAPTMLAKVVSVDEDEMTCVLKDDDENIIPEVRLRPVLDDNESQAIFPEVGTWALAVRIEAENEWMLIAAGQIEKWRLKTGDVEYTQSEDGFLLKKDTATLKNILTKMIKATQPIVVIYGNNPDYELLTEALADVNNLLQ